MKNLYLYDEKSKTQDSEFFTLLPGHVAIFTAHNIPVEKHDNPDPEGFKVESHIYVERATVAPGDLVVKSTSQTIDGLAVNAKMLPKAISKVMTCCGWKMTACDNLKALTVPGVYRLQLSDPSMIGLVSVDITTLTIAQAAMMPESVKFGY